MLIFTVRLGSPFTGKVLWIFWLFYYFAIYIYRIATTSSGWFSAENIPYFGAIIAGLVMIFALKPIRNLLFKGEIEEIAEAGTQTVERAKLLHKLQKEEVDAYGETTKGK